MVLRSSVNILHLGHNGLLAMALASLTCLPSNATASPTDQEIRFFEEQVRPLLARHCWECHGGQTQRGQLRVDSMSALLSGGESGPAVTPGKPDDSLLVEAIRYESFEMPPSGKLAPDQIAVLVKWIKLGAPWPGHDDAVREPAAAPSKLTDEDRAYWAFQPLQNSLPPAIASDREPDRWSRNDVDRFVQARLESEGLTPAPEADRRALMRRLHFDLTGLPPAPEEIDAFVADAAPDAHERLVDRLLDSPRYGERWARHWLDLVRYAESDGFRQDAFRPHAWRYRDYVIRAFNDDKPYDRFILEQIAGDELAPQDLETLAATSYLRHGIYEYNQRDARTQWDNILVDITNVTGEVFLGLGMGCARCHDHKFDPILKEDYFRLKAFFTPLLPRDDLPFATGDQWRQYQAQLAAWREKTAAVRARIDELERPLVEAARKRAADKFPADVRDMLLKEPSQRTPLEHQLAELANRQAGEEVARINFGTQLKGDQRAKWDHLQQELKQFDDLRPQELPPAFTATDVGPVAPPTPMASGREPRDIEPGLLAVLGAPPLKIEPPPSGNSTGRRTALARWLGGPDNPLTARVMVNRIWQQHFGAGLVPTASDFGRLGEAPSHPELLDWLARRFIADGWRFKPLHRLLVTSATYRQAARHPAGDAARQKDPENRWLWHMPVRRLDAEQIRDAMLAASGELELSLGGPSVTASQPRRSVYTRSLRNTRDPLLSVFDMADPFTSIDRRDVTTTPTQSLMMINGAWPLQRAEALAGRVRKLAGSEDRALVDHAYRLAYGRGPEPSEAEAILRFLHQRATGVGAEAPSLPASLAVESMPGRPSQAAVLSPGSPQSRLVAPDSPALPSGDFTVEAVILLRSLYDDASVRTIVSQWDDHHQHPGWALGVTSKGSSYQPRNLILQWVGDPARNGGGYEVLASNLRPELGKPYYVAVSVRVAETGARSATFFLQDLSSADAPLQRAEVAPRVTGHYRSTRSLVIGGRDGTQRHVWDGLIDDVRISSAALQREQLLLFDPAAGPQTAAFWRFEPAPGVDRDSTLRGHRLAVAAPTSAPADARTAALIDVSHVLLNSNEFLYVD